MYFTSSFGNMEQNSENVFRFQCGIRGNMPFVGMAKPEILPSSLFISKSQSVSRINMTKKKDHSTDELFFFFSSSAWKSVEFFV